MNSSVKVVRFQVTPVQGILGPALLLKGPILKPYGYYQNQL